MSTRSRMIIIIASPHQSFVFLEHLSFPGWHKVEQGRFLYLHAGAGWTLAGTRTVWIISNFVLVMVGSHSFRCNSLHFCFILFTCSPFTFTLSLMSLDILVLDIQFSLWLNTFQFWSVCYFSSRIFFLYCSLLLNLINFLILFISLRVILRIFLLRGSVNWFPVGSETILASLRLTRNEKWC